MAMIGDRHLHVVDQPFANARQVRYHWDAVPCQLRSRSYARKQQQLWRIDRAATDDDFSPRLRCLALTLVPKFDPAAAFAIHAQTGGPGIGQSSEVRSLQCCSQITDCAAVSLSALLRNLIQSEALLLASVEIRARRISQFQRASHERPAQRIRVLQVGHIDGSADAVMRRLAAFLMLHLLEPGQHIAVCPAFVAILRPAIIIGWVPALIHHGVHGAGAAIDLATRHILAPTVQARLGHSFIIPVELAVEELGKTRWHMDSRVAVGSARFQQQHRRTRVFAQARRDNCPGRARADDDVVRLVHQLALFPFERLVDHDLSIVYN